MKIVTGQYKKIRQFEYINNDNQRIIFNYSFNNESELFKISDFIIEGSAFTLKHDITPNKINNQFIFAIFDKQNNSIGSIRLDVEKDEFYLNLNINKITFSKEKESENSDEWKFGKY